MFFTSPAGPLFLGAAIFAGLFWGVSTLFRYFDSQFLGVRRGKFTGTPSKLKSPKWFREAYIKWMSYTYVNLPDLMNNDRVTFQSQIPRKAKVMTIALLADWADSYYPDDAAAAAMYRALTFDAASSHKKLGSVTDLYLDKYEKMLFENFLAAKAKPDYTIQFSDYYHDVINARSGELREVTIPSPSEIQYLQELPFEHTISMYTQEIKHY